MRRYKLDRVVVGNPEPRQAVWDLFRRTVRGTEYRYPVTDANQRARQQWEFVVRVPDDRQEPIELRPVQVPNDKALAQLDRRSLTFSRATKPGYTRFRYCQLSLSVPGGGRTRDVVHRGEESDLPYWIRSLGSRIKQKQTVRPTRGTDGHSLVILVPPDDHAMMIRLFLATKAWVLKRGVSLPG
jgi:hypothetical protein